MEILDGSEVYKMGLVIRYQFGSSTDTMLIVSTPFSKRFPHKIQYNEKEEINRALDLTELLFRGVMRTAAHELGIDKTTLWRKMKRLSSLS